MSEKVIVKVTNPTNGTVMETELWSEEHAVIFREILALREESNQLEATLATMKILNDPYRDIEIKLSMILDELWPDTEPEGQMRQLLFERRFQEAKRDALKQGLKKSGAILLRAAAAEGMPNGFKRPGG